MRFAKTFSFFTFLALALTGCSSITNLTPARQPRNSTGLYTVEAAWASRQQSIRPDSFRPSVVVGMESYPMRRTPLLVNRWEALVPIPQEKSAINYRFKFDFDYNSVPQPLPDSKMSREYKLEIVEGNR